MNMDRIKTPSSGIRTQRAALPEAKRFVQIKTVVMSSDAWRDCDYSARAAYVEISARLQWASGKPDPTNNGRLWLSRDEWGKAGCHREGHAD